MKREPTKITLKVFQSLGILVILCAASLDLKGIDVVVANLEQKDVKFTVRAARFSIYSRLHATFIGCST